MNYLNIWWVVACKIIVSAPVPVPFLWTLDLGFGTGLGLDNLSTSQLSQVVNSTSLIFYIFNWIQVYSIMCYL